MSDRPDPLPGYAWLQLPDRIREVSRGYLEFWYDPPGCALSDNYLKVQLNGPVAANLLMDVEIGGVTESGIQQMTRGRDATSPVVLPFVYLSVQESGPCPPM